MIESASGAFPFDDEPATRRSGVSLTEYARETEALLARGGDPSEAQLLVATARPPASDEAYDAPYDAYEVRELTSDAVALGDFGVDDVASEPPASALDRVPRLVVSPEELDWFPLGREASALVASIDGRSTLREVAARARVAPTHVMTLLELGIVAL